MVARNRSAQNAGKPAAKPSANAHAGIDEQPAKFSAFAALLAPAVVGLLLARAAGGRARRSLLGMPVAAYFSGHLTGPVGGELERWLWQHGGWSNAYMAATDMGRGLVAAWDLSSGDQVLYVPEHLLLRLPSTWAPRAPVKGESEEEVEDRAVVHTLVSLASELERDRLRGSIRDPYIDAVMRPSNNSTSAFNIAMWPPEAVALMTAGLLPNVGRQASYAFEDGANRDALRHVLSRFYGSSAASVAAGKVHLAPMVDMINHVDPDEATTRIVHKDGAVVVEATAHIPAGEEITISYGALPNAHLLAFYGFGMPGNEMGAQVFELPDADKSADPDCRRLLHELAGDTVLQLSMALHGEIEEELWAACLRPALVRESGESLPLADACRLRAASIERGLRDLGAASRPERAEEAGVLRELQDTAREELGGLRRCAGAASDTVKATPLDA